MQIKQPIEFDESLIGKGIDFRSSVDFYIDGKPRGKERPRSRRFKNFITTYTPKNTIQYENHIKKTYLNSVGTVKLQGPLQATVTAIFSPPESISRKKKQKLLEQKFYTKKPDCDNIEKIVFDALNGLAYNDDSQICDVYTKKRYGEIPMVRVSLRELE